MDEPNSQNIFLQYLPIVSWSSSPPPLSPKQRIILEIILLLCLAMAFPPQLIRLIVRTNQSLIFSGAVPSRSGFGHILDNGGASNFVFY
eukprot:scaffold378772_cov31-Attheya_sp.AAC.1